MLLLHRRFMRLTLVLLWILAGCAAKPSMRGSQWHQQGGPVDVDFEAPTPQQAVQLRQRGVRLPQASQGLADPRAHRDFVDLRVTAVGFGLTTGGYLLYCEGVALPVLVPESHVNLGLTRAESLNASIYPDRATAMADMEAKASGLGHASYAYYRGAGGALIVPTLFSPATTPRTARAMLEVRKHLTQTAQRELKVLLLTVTGTRLLQGVFSRVVRVSSEPAARPLARKEGPGGEAPTPRQPVPQSAAPASAPAAPAPAPGAPAPSPGLIQALTGKNPTPPVAPGPRLPQDVAARPEIPPVRETNRPIGPSPRQNAQLQADLQYLESIGATNIRVNQQQLTYSNGQRVGINRPDLQFDYRAAAMMWSTRRPHRGAAQGTSGASPPTTRTRRRSS